ncbi:MAG: bifunctional serine/threonine-protein kinase/formylglycine-generating enzyme family protein [Acidobacteriota bacterium]|nr:bifunctional serine/threonine-protein kinase/formylglycine-generating enzyme family protein [Acidobacteriota bacterium]
MTSRARQPMAPFYSEEPGFYRLIDSLSLADYMYFGVLSCRELRDGEPVVLYIQKCLRQISDDVIKVHHLRHPQGNPFKANHLGQELIDPLLEDFEGNGYHLFVIDALWEITGKDSSEEKRFFRRLNELRNTIMDRLPGPLLLLTTTDLAVTFAREAPDFWSVRSIWEEIQDPVAKPKPDFTDAEHRSLAEALEAAYLAQEEKTIGGQDISELERHILDLKREMRKGGAFRPGDILGGRYRLIERIGTGGFAAVWKTYDRVGSRLVAVKILHGQFSEDRTRKERFFRGARIMGTFNHPNITTVIEEKCEEDGLFYFVMEYAEGGNLENEVLRDGPLPIVEVIRIVLDIGDGLAYAHSRGAIHRDVKPSNVLFTKDRRVKLTDFDLVRAPDTTGGTRTGAMGSFLFAAPEALVDAKSVGPQADVYGLAMTALFALVGKLDLDVLRHPGPTLDRLDVSEEVKETLALGLSWDLDTRFNTISSFCKAVEASGHPRVGQPPSRGTLSVGRDSMMHESSWVQLPPGSFIMGDDQSESAWEQPAHRVETTQSIFISRTPITNHTYRLFIESGGYLQSDFWCEEGWSWLQLKDADFEKWYNEIKVDRHNYFVVSPEWYRSGNVPRFWTDPNFNRDTQPVVGINWFEATAFCRWLTATLEKAAPNWLPQDFTVRLLTEADWEYAAKGNEGRVYPWGATAPDVTLANFGANTGKTTPVGRFPKGSTPEGCIDMAGNVWEWCLDHWDPFAYKKRKCGMLDPIVKNDVPARVLRGGSWDDLALSMRCSARMGLLAATRDKYFGFRCCIV